MGAARTMRPQQEKNRWLSYEEAYSLVRELVEAHRKKAHPESPDINKIRREIMGMPKQAATDALNEYNLRQPFILKDGPSSGSEGGAGSGGAPKSV